MIAEIYLRNFKAFEELSLDFRPITLFLGPNNSGKSSILAALRVLVQTTESYDPQVPILLNGTMGDFGTYKDIVFDNSRRRHIELQTSLQRMRRQQPSLGFEDEWPSVSRGTQTVAVKYGYRARRREIVLRGVDVKVDGQLLLATKYSEETERQLIERIGRKAVPSAIKSTLSRTLRMQNFLPTVYYGPLRARSRPEGGTAEEFLTKDVEESLREVSRATRDMMMYFRSIEYLGAMRMPPARTYLFTGERRQRIGANGENAASVLVMDASRMGSRSKNIARNVRGWLSKAGIASDLRIDRISDRHYEIRIQHPETREYQNYADVGYGNSQVLPVLVGGYNLTSQSSYIVEEPEIHLHPRAQAELGDFFLDLYSQGVQSIIETHSEHLILRLQQHIASGRIRPENVRLYYVHAKADKKCVDSLRLDNEGRFIDEWPEGFFPERLEESKKLSRIRFGKQS